MNNTKHPSWTKIICDVIIIIAMGMFAIAGLTRLEASTEVLTAIKWGAKCIIMTLALGFMILYQTLWNKE